MSNNVDTTLYLEPLKYYNYFLKDKHLENIEAFLSGAVEKTNFSIDANKETVEQYKKKCKESDELAKKIGKNRAFSGFLLFIGIILCLIIVGIFIILHRKNKVKKDIEELEKQKAKIDKEKAHFLAEAEGQTAPLVAALDNETAVKLMEQTAPILDFDERCEPELVDRMVEQFGLKEDEFDNHSTLVVQSGEINGNPFMLTQTYAMNMYPKIYTGHLVISWTTTERDGNGNTRVVTHTQTLTATVTEDAPSYSVQTQLILASDAAPKLSFKREPAGLAGKSEKEMDRYVKSFEKKDAKAAEKAVKKGQSYTKMANSKFEAYLNSSDRNNEVEYRLLFTPLAQNNICTLFSQSEPYGDDITYYKKGCINLIYSAHSRNMDYSGGSYNYSSYDYEEIKKKFTDYNMNFFQGLYYDFLLFLSIPMFHQHTPLPFIPTHEPTRNVSSYETECLLNKLEDTKQFAHEDTNTEIILTTEVVNKGKNVDEINVVAHSFKEVPHVTMVPTLGGDGRMHPVPVHYFTYEPLTKKTPMVVFKNAVPKGKEGIIMEYRHLYLANK